VLTASGWWAATSKAIGSLSSWPPGAIVTPGLPPNVTARLVPARVAATFPDIARATCAPSITSGAVPYTLLKRSRTCRPSMAGYTICRTVRPPISGARYSAGKSSRCGTACNAVPQALTQRSAGASSASALADGNKVANSVAAATAERTRRFIDGRLFFREKTIVPEEANWALTVRRMDPLLLMGRSTGARGMASDAAPRRYPCTRRRAVNRNASEHARVHPQRAGFRAQRRAGRPSRRRAMHRDATEHAPHPPRGPAG